TRLRDFYTEVMNSGAKREREIVIFSELTEQTEQQDSNKHAQLALIAFEILALPSEGIRWFAPCGDPMVSVDFSSSKQEHPLVYTCDNPLVSGGFSSSKQEHPLVYSCNNLLVLDEVGMKIGRFYFFSQYANTWEATNLLPNRHRKLRTQRELLDSDAGFDKIRTESLNNIQVVFSSWTLKNKNYFEMQNKTDYEELL
ncbi:26541_t:CDS:2, partial [Gigaspora margarita]